MRRRPTAARLAALWRARRQRLRLVGAHWYARSGLTTTDAEEIRDATAPVVWRVLETLTVEQLQILCADHVRPADFPELSAAQRLAVFEPRRLRPESR